MPSQNPRLKSVREFLKILLKLRIKRPDPYMDKMNIRNFLFIFIAGISFVYLGSADPFSVVKCLFFSQFPDLQMHRHEQCKEENNTDPCTQ